MTTNNPYILKGIKPTKALVCLQKNTDKILPTESDFIKANKNSFGDDIGSVTNRVTSMYSVLARYEVGSPEWIELDYRIKCGQNYQQNAIDKAKGIISKPMPKEWYMYAPNKILDTDTEEVEFYVVEQTRINDVNYILVADSMNDEAEALILKETVNEEDSEDVVYSEIEDDVELEAIFKVFSEILDDIDIEM